MGIGKKIEQLRCEKNIPIYVMCNIMALSSENEYRKICKGTIEPTAYQLIMLIDVLGGPLT